MPIIEVPSKDSPLTQGDIFKDLTFFATSEDVWTGGAKPIQRKVAGALIISRPCAIEHKNSVMVAEIEKYNELKPSDCKTFNDALDFLTDYRDGLDTPDRFYLGQIPALGAGRFRAKLDFVHTALIPKDRAKLQECRIGRLSIEFARDLHIRLFRSFASLGFDDQRWFADADLDWLLSMGNMDLAVAEAELTKAAADGFKNQQHKQSLEQAVGMTKERLVPLQQELQRRKAIPTGTGAAINVMSASPFGSKAVPLDTSSGPNPS
jgi:hypothetical protein